MLALGGCAARPVNPPLPQVDPSAGDRFETRLHGAGKRLDLVVLAFAGCGTRAAAFPRGVLEFVRRTEATARVASPANQGTPGGAGTGRSEVAAQLGNGILLDGATFGDLGRAKRPLIGASATGTSTGSRFVFSQCAFEVVCPGLDGLQIIEALDGAGMPSPLHDRRRIIVFVVDSLSSPPTDRDDSENPPGRWVCCSRRPAHRSTPTPSRRWNRSGTRQRAGRSCARFVTRRRWRPTRTLRRPLRGTSRNDHRGLNRVPAPARGARGEDRPRPSALEPAP